MDDDFVPDVAKYGTYADFYPIGDGLGERSRKTCAAGHPVATRGHWPCPRGCGVYVRAYACADVHCRAWVTSLAHETVCPP